MSFAAPAWRLELLISVDEQSERVDVMLRFATLSSEAHYAVFLRGSDDGGCARIASVAGTPRCHGERTEARQNNVLASRAQSDDVVNDRFVGRVCSLLRDSGVLRDRPDGVRFGHRSLLPSFYSR